MLMPPIDRYMTYRPIVIAPTASVAAARAVMTEHLIHHLPVVVNDDELVGIVSERDLAVVHAIPGADPGAIEVAQVMCRPIAVASETTLDVVSELMRNEPCDCVVVRDRRGLKGIFTYVDVLTALDDVLRRATE